MKDRRPMQEKYIWNNNSNRYFMKIVAMVTLVAAMLTAFSPGIAGPAEKQPIRWQVNRDSSGLAGEWVLQPVLASDTATGKLPTLSFNLGQKKFTGFTGCNQVNGKFNLHGDQLVIGKDMDLTNNTCEGFNEKEFIINLLRVNRFRVRDGVLWLMIDQVPVSKWTRNPVIKKLL